MARVDIMVDIETLGTDNNAVITQVAAVCFDITTGVVSEKFNTCLDIETYPEFHVDAGTLKWWLKTNPQLLADIILRGEDQAHKTLREFRDFILAAVKVGGREVYLWGNGSVFDNTILTTNFKLMKITWPLRYDADRDMRTILDMALMKTGLSKGDVIKMFEDAPDVARHDAMNDVLFQIRVTCWAYDQLINVVKVPIKDTYEEEVNEKT